MFSNFKDKLVDISRSVYFLSTDSDTSEPLSSKVNLAAGSEILSHFRTQWFELHQLSEVNAKNAEKVAETIARLQAKVSKDHKNITLIVELLSTRPSLNDSVEQCVQQMSNLHDSFETVEKALVDLEDVIERNELEKKKLEHQHQLALYKERKLENLEVKRNDFAKKYAKKYMNHELQKKKLLEEKQRKYEEEFKKDMESIKKQGTVAKSKPKLQQPSALLEEIHLDLDQKELNAFLEELPEAKPADV